VEAIETHMSWVFLTDRHAYKLKKPVSYDFLDFSALDARRFYCQEEVRLNARLAAEVYLGIVELTLNPLGHLQLDGDGTVIDWLTRRHRLPTHHMLDYAIKNGTASREDICRIAARLASFYRTCPPIAIDSTQYGSRFACQIESIRKELTRDAFKLPVEQVSRVCSAQSAVLRKMADLFDERVGDGKDSRGSWRPATRAHLPQTGSCNNRLP
jgi:aminoglycoside phosphotransferase family enzyme